MGWTLLFRATFRSIRSRRHTSVLELCRTQLVEAWQTKRLASDSRVPGKGSWHGALPFERGITCPIHAFTIAFFGKAQRIEVEQRKRHTCSWWAS